MARPFITFSGESLGSLLDFYNSGRDRSLRRELAYIADENTDEALQAEMNMHADEMRTRIREAELVNEGIDKTEAGATERTQITAAVERERTQLARDQSQYEANVAEFERKAKVTKASFDAASDNQQRVVAEATAYAAANHPDMLDENGNLAPGALQEILKVQPGLYDALQATNKELAGHIADTMTLDAKAQRGLNTKGVTEYRAVDLSDPNVPGELRSQLEAKGYGSGFVILEGTVDKEGNYKPTGLVQGDGAPLVASGDVTNQFGILSDAMQAQIGAYEAGMRRNAASAAEAAARLQETAEGRAAAERVAAEARQQAAAATARAEEQRQQVVGRATLRRPSEDESLQNARSLRTKNLELLQSYGILPDKPVQNRTVANAALQLTDKYKQATESKVPLFTYSDEDREALLKGFPVAPGSGATTLTSATAHKNISNMTNTEIAERALAASGMSAASLATEGTTALSGAALGNILARSPDLKKISKAVKDAAKTAGMHPDQYLQLAIEGKIASMPMELRTFLAAGGAAAAAGDAKTPAGPARALPGEDSPLGAAFAQTLMANFPELARAVGAPNATGIQDLTPEQLRAAYALAADATVPKRGTFNLTGHTAAAARGAIERFGLRSKATHDAARRAYEEGATFSPSYISEILDAAGVAASRAVKPVPANPPLMVTSDGAVIRPTSTLGRPDTEISVPLIYR